MENVNCLRCRFRHEDNGNCTAVGGFCTAVAAAHCPMLREYLNTGLTPKEAKRMSNILMDVGIDYNCSWEYVKNWLLDDRLRKLAEADKEGRIVVLPCKVGDVVYGFYGGKTILPMVAKWIETNTDGWCIAAQYTPMAPRFYRFSDFGKTVFLTREEAEKVLEAMKDG